MTAGNRNISFHSMLAQFFFQPLDNRGLRVAAAHVSAGTKTVRLSANSFFYEFDSIPLSIALMLLAHVD